ncbi:MAG: bifunctional glutamate N-acetyltransferase/amino-acid acetyltransferase ArgJ [Alphaproteobacteria bacterium]|jgi:glutamate N-acetyltransferase / amino-acid N-acetyltransferase|nr:bifunctional glutamate N-acetyltransferase/amino-acid acetyltransferase ArgJ [Alphaproteobacteria bacterium]MBT4711917.1 bifunctional glutamate N-acetyltransferase/amino-acid acetyltransferase ArgJ [Alphaproteobacteria bacterium]
MSADDQRSPLAPNRFPKMAEIPGVSLAAQAAGIRYSGRPDVLLVALDPGTTAAGVFTKSKTASAPVLWCQDHIGAGKARGLVVNSGNANAFSGHEGTEAVALTTKSAAQALGCPQSQIFAASTGVIGEALPWQKFTKVMGSLAAKLGPGNWNKAAHAIRTTDTYAKGATRTADIGGVTVTINGIAKGSGMIAPDMGTMLAFVFTDAKIPAKILQSLVRGGANKSFNAITVDSDTSTSDTVLAFATGKGARHKRVSGAGDGHLKDFKAKFNEVLLSLAHQIVRDGEGASKFVTVNVAGAESGRAAKVIAMAIANSPLVKTMVAGADPNWGRIVMAVGKAGEKADRDRIAISIGDFPVAKRGVVIPGYDEAPVADYMKSDEVTLSVNVGVGRGKFTVWTCDLTHDYIRINADYRS